MWDGQRSLIGAENRQYLAGAVADECSRGCRGVRSLSAGSRAARSDPVRGYGAAGACVEPPACHPERGAPGAAVGGPADADAPIAWYGKYFSLCARSLKEIEQPTHSQAAMCNCCVHPCADAAIL